MSRTGSLDGSTNHRREVLAGVRCGLCDTVGRLIVLARLPGVVTVLCTTCWCENDLHGGPR